MNLTKTVRYCLLNPSLDMHNQGHIVFSTACCCALVVCVATTNIFLFRVTQGLVRFGQLIVQDDNALQQGLAFTQLPRQMVGKAHQIIRSGAGAQWDPEIVECFHQWVTHRNETIGAQHQAGGSIIPQDAPLDHLAQAVMTLIQ